MSDDRETRLELRQEAGGGRHYIGEVSIHAGDQLDVKIDGKWYEGRYEAHWATVRGHETKQPAAVFYFVDQFGAERAVRIGTATPIRLPSPGRTRFAT
jgi:hypothetical protein